MAVREIEPDPYIQTEYFKFQAIGDKLGGWFVQKAPGKYGDNYTFRKKDGSHVTITPSGALKNQLEKAKLEQGHLVVITLVKQIPNETAGYSPTNVFKVLADDAPEQKMPGAAAPKPKAKDDVDF